MKCWPAYNGGLSWEGGWWTEEGGGGGGGRGGGGGVAGSSRMGAWILGSMVGEGRGRGGW